MKKMFFVAVLGLCSVHAATAQSVPVPAQSVPVPAKAPSGNIHSPITNATLLDILSERIGDGQAYRLTRKGGETIVCTLQGRTDTSIIVSQCHFHIVHQVVKAITHKEAFPWYSDQPEYTDISDTDALKMLETKPAQFHGADIMYGVFGPNSRGILNAYQLYHVGDDNIKVVESDVVQVEYINLPASALPADMPPAIIVVPTPKRVNPSMFPVWPPPRVRAGQPLIGSKQRFGSVLLRSPFTDETNRAEHSKNTNLLPSFFQGKMLRTCSKNTGAVLQWF